MQSDLVSGYSYVQYLKVLQVPRYCARALWPRALMHLFLQAHSHKWNTKEELGKDKRETPTRQRLLVVVGTEIFTIATPARGVVIFIRANLATRYSICMAGANSESIVCAAHDSPANGGHRPRFAG